MTLGIIRPIRLSVSAFYGRDERVETYGGGQYQYVKDTRDRKIIDFVPVVIVVRLRWVCSIHKENHLLFPIPAGKRL
jgi:hypothetical protein